MAEIDNGALSFQSTLDNEQMNAAIAETLRRVQGLSDGTAESGEKIDASFDEMGNNIRDVLSQIGAACSEHENEINRLTQEYETLKKASGDAFMAGDDNKASQLNQEAEEIRAQIALREQLLTELRESSNELEQHASRIENEKNAVTENANARSSLRAQIRAVKEEMAALVLAEAQQGRTLDETSGRYAELKQILGQLTDVQSDLQTQASVLANDEKGFAGVISGLTGMSGAASAATGAMSLFGSENEDLQKVMTKVQSVMAITIGLQQVEQMLNKDSAFMLVTVAKAKELLTIATTKLSVALGISTVAAKALMATLTLGLSVAITAIVVLFEKFYSKAQESRKAAEEFTKSLTENCYKPIAAIESLSQRWNELGNNLKAKEQFVIENSKAFDELGTSIHSVAEAENLLIKNKDAFVNAQIEKAKATYYFQQSEEKIKKLIELEQKRDSMSDTVNVVRQIASSTSGYVRTEIVGTKVNDEKVKIKKEITALRNEITNGFTMASEAENRGLKKLRQAGITLAGEYASGTVGAIEQAIAREEEALKRISDPAKYRAKLAEIDRLRKQMDNITGGSGKGGKSGASTTKNTTDPFIDMLNKRKSEYAKFSKWLNAEDETIRKAAKTEFASLLAEGASYTDFLQNQRDKILQIAESSRTKEQNEHLRQLNDALAEETKKTVLESFNAELSNALTNARTTIEMLNVIEERRKELANDNTDIDNAKSDALDEAEKTIRQQQEEETKQLLEQYASYLDKKIALEMQFTNDLALLQKRRAAATSDAERASIDAAIANRSKQYERDMKGSGDADYDRMVEQYASFEKKKQSIIDDYAEKRKIAVEHGNQEMIQELDKAQAKALSTLAFDELKANPDWEKMFGNLDEVSTKKLQELIENIEGMTAYLGIEFDPQDLAKLKESVQSAKTEIQERNPFKALIQGIKDYGKATDAESKKKSLTNMFNSASDACSLVSGGIDAITNGLTKLGMEADSETAVVLKDLSGIASGAGQVATGIATGNPLSIIQGSVGLLTSAFDLFNSRDRRAERQIKAHQEAINKLTNAYKQLEWQIEKSLGTEVYFNQRAAIRNMEEQKEHLQAMWEAEIDKKKTDWDRVADFKEQYAELERQIQDQYDEIANDILQTSAKDMANELSDALVSAFEKGEDAAKAFENVVNDVLKNAIVNQLKKQFIEKQLDTALDELQNALGWNGDDFVFNGLSDAEIDAFKSKVQSIANNFNQALGVYSDLFRDITEDPDTSLTGAVKGVSEETASILAGQMNAIRINQLETTTILRQQLSELTRIANNTSYNYHLQKLERIVSLLENRSNDGELRSQGLS